MPGKNDSTEPQSNEIVFCLDECLPKIFGEALQACGYKIVYPVPGEKDEDLIPKMGRLRQVWVTKDERAKTRHETRLRDANISVVWVRGLSQGKRRAVQRTASMKDILRMLITKLDAVVEEISKARGNPRYFLLYTSSSTKSRDMLEPYTSLRQLQDRLSGTSQRNR